MSSIDNVDTKARPGWTRGSGLAGEILRLDRLVKSLRAVTEPLHAEVEALRHERAVLNERLREHSTLRWLAASRGIPRATLLRAFTVWLQTPEGAAAVAAARTQTAAQMAEDARWVEAEKRSFLRHQPGREK